jgi:hypothetical protein
MFDFLKKFWHTIIIIIIIIITCGIRYFELFLSGHFKWEFI